MIEYLDQLVANREYAKAEKYAESLLVTRDNSPEDLLAINCAILTARAYQGNHQGAIVIGESVLQTARSLALWDRYGIACLDIGFAYLRLRRLNEAIQVWYDYLSVLAYYRHASRFEAGVRSNIALAFSALGESQKAVKELKLAIETARRDDDPRMVHALRHMLLNTLLMKGDTEGVPRLLAQTSRYLRNHSDSPDIEQSLHWHAKFRVDYALLTKRYFRARLLALRGLNTAAGQTEPLFSFHMLLANIARHTGDEVLVMGHLTAARACALSCHRFDLEQQAAEALYQHTSDRPDALFEMEKYYLHTTGSSKEEVP